MNRTELLQWIDTELACASFKDYAPNGLQVEGRDTIKRIVCAVTASRAAVECAIEQKADLLLVHHGMFWKNEMPQIIGWKKDRIALLLNHNINLSAYHLPLDAHPVLGNNACLAQRFNWQITHQSGDQNLLFWGKPCAIKTVQEWADCLEQSLQRKPLLLGDAQKIVKKIAWCSGGAQGFLSEVSEGGADLYITGEASEAQFHLAFETQTPMLAAGHHATERFGIQALAAKINQQFGIEYTFFDDQNPV